MASIESGEGLGFGPDLEREDTTLTFDEDDKEESLCWEQVLVWFTFGFVSLMGGGVRGDPGGGGEDKGDLDRIGDKKGERDLGEDLPGVVCHDLFPISSRLLSSASSSSLRRLDASSDTKCRGLQISSVCESSEFVAEEERIWEEGGTSGVVHDVTAELDDTSVGVNSASGRLVNALK